MRDGAAATAARRPSTRPCQADDSSFHSTAWMPPKTVESRPGAVSAQTFS